MKKTSNSEPQRLSISHNAYRQQVVTLAIDITSTEDGYEYIEVVLLPGRKTYEDIVSAVIREKYPQERMEAIINNYLADPSDEDSVQEFQVMQSWRKQAKTVATWVLEQLGQ